MVPVASRVVLPPLSAALTGEDRRSTTVSFASSTVSPRAATCTVWLVVPGAKVSVPALTAS